MLVIEGGELKYLEKNPWSPIGVPDKPQPMWGAQDLILGP